MNCRYCEGTKITQLGEGYTRKCRPCNGTGVEPKRTKYYYNLRMWHDGYEFSRGFMADTIEEVKERLKTEFTEYRITKLERCTRGKNEQVQLDWSDLR